MDCATRYAESSWVRERPGADRKASRKKQNQPIPVEDLRANNEQHNRAAQRDNGRERRRVDEQMQDLTTPATPDQIMQRTTLVSHLTTIIADQGRLACRLGPHLPLQTRKVANDFLLQFVAAFANCKLAAHRDIPHRAALG